MNKPGSVSNKRKIIPFGLENKIISMVVFFLLSAFGWGCGALSEVKVSTLHKDFSARAMAGKKVLVLPFYNATDTRNTTLEHILLNMCKAKFRKTEWVTEKYLEDIKRDMEETLIKIEPYEQLDLFISEFRNTGKINRKDFLDAFPGDISFVLAASLESEPPAASSNQDYLFKGGLQFWRVDPKEKVFDCTFHEKVTYDDFDDYSNSFSEAKTIVYRQTLFQTLSEIPIR